MKFTRTAVIGALAALAFVFVQQQLAADSGKADAAKPAKAESRIWTTDYTAALARAKQENKPVLLDFTGSDWCPPCIAVHERVLSTPEFEAYAHKNLVTVYLDFPREKKVPAAVKAQNDKLLADYGVRAFPTFIILDPNGKELERKVGFDTSTGVQGFIKLVEGAKAKGTVAAQ